MTETRPYIPWDMIQGFMIDTFVSYGIPLEDAKICTDVLLESDRRGIESHGCNRFKPIYLDRIDAGILKPVTEYEVVKETPTTLVVDAHDGMGMVASYKAMKTIIEKAKKYGMAMAAIRNSSHYGIAGYWSSMAVNEGMIGITGTNARPSIAPTFGVENMLGTNPLTVGMPTDERKALDEVEVDHAELAACVYAAGQLANVHHVSHQKEHHAAVRIERKRQLLLVSDGGDDGVVLYLVVQKLSGFFQGKPLCFRMVLAYVTLAKIASRDAHFYQKNHKNRFDSAL